MTMKTGAGDDPFADDEDEDAEAQANEQPEETTDDSETMSTTDIPYILRRQRVKDGRPHEHVAFLRDEYHELESDIVGDVADAMDLSNSDVSVLDVREALVELGDRHPDELAEILNSWGYEHRE